MSARHGRSGARMARRGTLVLLLLSPLGGCRDGDLGTQPTPPSSDPLLGVYQAVRVNGATVPFTVPPQGTCGVQHLGGSVLLDEGMAFVSRLRRIRTTCPSGATQETQLANTGTYRLAGDSIYFTPGGISDPFVGSFEGGALHIRHATGDYVLIKQ